MLTYKYTAKDSATGQMVKSEVQAESEQAAAQLIRKEGYTPIDINVSSGTVVGASKLFGKVKSKDKILFSRQLATLLNAGVPLVQALNSVTDQTTSKPLRSVASKVIADVESGQVFSKALAKHPKVFSQIYISLVEAGETSGTLDDALERLADQQEKDAEIISKVRSAMVYPIIVLFVMMGVLIFMLVTVLPQVKQLYDGIKGAELPLLTSILLALSTAIVKYWWATLIALGLAVFFTSKFANTVGGKAVFDKIKMRAWPIGPLFMKMYMARFARTSTTLVASGVPLIQVLEIAANAVNNVHISKSITTAIEKIRGGKSLSESITDDPNFLPLVPNMLKIGEQSGAMENMLAKTAEYYEKEVDTQVKTISTIIEPVLMVILGIMAFIIVAAVLLPVYGLAGKNLGPS